MVSRAMPGTDDSTRLEARRVASLEAAALAFPPNSPHRGAILRLIWTIYHADGETPEEVLLAACDPRAGSLIAVDEMVARRVPPLRG